MGGRHSESTIASSNDGTTALLSVAVFLAKLVGFVENTLKVPFFHLLLEVVLILWIIRLLTRKSYSPKEQRINLTKEEEDALIQEWQPEPLVPKQDIADYILHPKIVHGKAGLNINIDGRDCLNLATFNFLGFIGKEEIEDRAIKSLRTYGVGACGPRAFYGTIDVHLHLEAKIADFLGTEEAVLYSYGYSTIASILPAYSKQTDVVFCDDGVGFALQQGIIASRSRVYWFRHNDMVDLERKLLEQEERDIKNPKKAKATRRFLVVEGIYANYGDIAPLPKLVQLKKKYKVRMFIDESMSFGVLGKQGKGITEHFDVSVEDVDMIAASLETSLATVGGFATGQSFVVDHQRLSGRGYAFSASLPPLLASAADAGLDIMKQSPEMFEKLRNNANTFRTELAGIEGFSIDGDPICPIIHLRLTGCNSEKSRQEQEDVLQKIVNKAFDEDIAITVARYINKQEMRLPNASIRITVNCDLDGDQIKSSAKKLKIIAKNILC